MPTIARLVLMLPMLLPLSACGLSGGPVNGQVTDPNTNKPIPDVIVVVKWQGNIPAFAESRKVCVHVDSAVSDREGKFRMPGWSKPSTVGPIVLDLSPVITAYKRGYRRTIEPSEKEGVVHMSQFRGTAAERLEYLSRVFASSNCGSESESEKNLIPIQRAIYQEALPLAETKQDKGIVETILYYLEILEFGFETAERRHLDRGKR